jgi:very-short-patch-repair endonuclease
MERKPATPHRRQGVDAVIARFAARQHRVVARRQLLAAGVGSEAIRHRVGTNRLYLVYRGVYAVGFPKLDNRGRWLAAVLACGDEAVLSHRSAGIHLGLLDPKSGPVHVTLPGSRTSRRPGIVMHATRSLPRAERITRNGIPCTSAERVLIDLAAAEPVPVLERAVEQAFALHLLGRSRMRDALAGAGGHHGAATLRALLGKLLADLPFTRSELERRFLRLVHDAGLPKPRVNRHRSRHRVDFHWTTARIVVETDGRATHDTPYGFHNDRARDLDLELAGWHVIRLSWWQVRDEPERVGALLCRRLSAGGTLPWSVS